MIGTKRNTKAGAGAPAFQLGDLTVLAAELRKLRELNEQYDRGIAALIAVRRVVNGWETPKTPEMPLTTRREILELTGTADELAAFDAEHSAAMRAEQDTAAKAERAASSAPARMDALERHLRELAKRMVAEVDPGAIEAECERLFAPSAQRMLDAAKSFLEAWRDMRAVGAALRYATAITEVDVYGEGMSHPRFEPIGRAADGEWLPMQIATIPSIELATLNRHFMGGHSVILYEAVGSALQAAAGVDGGNLTLRRPGAEPQERARLGFGHRIQADDPSPPMRRPAPIGLRPQSPEYVAGIPVQLPSAPPATVISVTNLSQG